MIRMVGLDLDGTLLRQDKSVSAYSREVIRRAAEKGTVIVPVTGRPLAGVPSEVKSLPGVRYCITSNGAAVYDLQEGKVLKEVLMGPERALSVLAASEGIALIREVFTGGWGYHVPEDYAKLRSRFAGTPVMSYIDGSRKKTDSLEDFVRGCAGGLENISIMCGCFEDRERIREKLSRIKGINVILPWKTDLEITDGRAEKGDALLFLAERLGIRREETMAAGDSDNDLSLLKKAGIALAMGNASAHIREAADFVTEDNEHDGAARAVERFILEER